MTKKYIVRLSEEERQRFGALISKGKGAAYKIKHANIFLFTQPPWAIGARQA